jgi:ketosteroid isomerase-like protein
MRTAGHSAEEEQALAIVQQLLDTLLAKDNARFRALLRPEGVATLYRNSQFLTLSLSGLADRIEILNSGPDRLEESMPEPLVRVDQNIAMVWGAYSVTRNGRPDHCGTNIFTLVKEGGGWRIASITDNSRPCHGEGS